MVSRLIKQAAVKYPHNQREEIESVLYAKKYQDVLFTSCSGYSNPQSSAQIHHIDCVRVRKPANIYVL